MYHMWHPKGLFWIEPDYITLHGKRHFEGELHIGLYCRSNVKDMIHWFNKHRFNFAKSNVCDYLVFISTPQRVMIKGYNCKMSLTCEGEWLTIKLADWQELPFIEVLL